MLVAGVGAMLDVATFCYLALAVYLIWLLFLGQPGQLGLRRGPAG